MIALPPHTDAVVEWGVRASLLSYLAAARDFEVETTGDATFSPSAGVRMTGRVGGDGVLRLQGSVVLRAHAGALSVPLVDVHIDGRALTIADPVAPEGEGVEAPRFALVDLVPADAAGDDPSLVGFGTRLAANADVLFLYNYVPGSDFDPLTIRFSES